MINRAKQAILPAALLAGGLIAVVCFEVQCGAKKSEREWTNWFASHEDQSHERIMKLQKRADALLAPSANCSGVEQLLKGAELQKNIEDLILLTKTTNRPWLVEVASTINWAIPLLAFIVGLLLKRRQ